MRGPIKSKKVLHWAAGAAALSLAVALTAPSAGAADLSVHQPLPTGPMSEAAAQWTAAHHKITVDRARHYIAAQPALIERGRALAAELGDRSAGFFLEAPSEQPVVTVLDPAAAEKVRAAGARAKYVQYGTAELNRAMETLGKTASVPDTSWSIDTPANRVVLRIGPAAKGNPHLGSLQAAAARLGDAVRIEHLPGSTHPTAMKMGDEIRITTAPYASPGNVCSLGFNVHSPGYKYIITAGHCVKSGKKYYDSNWKEIGGVAEYHYGDSLKQDWALINNSSGETWPSDVNRYGASDQLINGVYKGDPATGVVVCKSGRTTKVTCGAITNVGVSMTETDGTRLDGMLWTRVNSQGGDSGGPLYLNDKGLGIAHGGLEYDDRTQGGSFQPLQPILDKIGDITLNAP
ncbi:S1 family peptidase [Streptomyces varsoviensis]|uniref:S1 family peptidase n=1 Tax=Streptomyces varsoviensis TaxID=67373 RepID=UPI0033E3CBD5